MCQKYNLKNNSVVNYFYKLLIMLEFHICQETLVCMDLNQIMIQQKRAIVCLLFPMMKHYNNHQMICMEKFFTWL